jgi:hypothetical protein
MLRVAHVITVLLAVTVIAGCLGPGNVAERPGDERLAGIPLPVLWCSDPVTPAGCNQLMTTHPDRSGNEVTIAVNPVDPKNIVGGAKDYYPPDAGECVWDGMYVTKDGGRSYQDRSLDGSPWRLLGDPDSFTPNYASQFWCTTDPVLYFDTQGTLYYLLMAYQADRVTGSKLGEDSLPSGALNDWAFNRAVQIVAISDDGGASFHTFTPVLEGSYPVAFHDKGWIAVSNDGTIHVMWLGIVAPGNLYFRSTDGGQTYSDAEVLAMVGMGSGQGSFVDVGVGSEVYASWYSGGGIQMRRSDDTGETWDEQRRVIETNPSTMPGLSARDRRTGFPHLATDRWAESPYAGAVYFVWQDKCQDEEWSSSCTEGNASIYFAASFDGGDTFTTPLRLNDDRDEDLRLATENWQIFPAVSVSPGGVIDVSWMDTRLGGAATLKEGTGGSSDLVGEEHLKFDQYYTYSLDGGKTWASNIRVRDIEDQGWDPQYSNHQNGMIFIGDYNDIDSSWAAAHPVWPDTRGDLRANVYTAVILRPLFAEGWSDEAKAAKRADLLARGHVDAGHPFLDH